MKTTRMILGTLSLLIPFNFILAADVGTSGGGGGGTVLPTRGTVADVIVAVTYSKPIVLAYFNALETNNYLHFNEILPGQVKLFQSLKDVFAVMESGLKIEVKRTGPCYDRDGYRTDASVVAQSPAKICISAKRIVRKVPKHEIAGQVAALLTHEISHLLGTTETEASALQFHAYEWMRGMRIVGTWSNRPWAFKEMPAAIEIDAEAMNSPVLQHEWSKARTDQFMRLIEVTATELGWAKSLMPLRFVPIQHLLGTWFRLSIMNKYLCSLNSELSGAIRSECAADYEKAFGSKEEIATNDEGNGLKPRVPNPAPIKRMRSKEDVALETSRVVTESEEYVAEFERTIEGTFDVIAR